MTSPEFDQGGEILETQVFYEDAARWADLVQEIIDQQCGIEQVKSVIQDFNDKSSLKGSALIIESSLHYIDWSYGDASSEDNISFEIAKGKFQGVFIGYQVAPALSRLTGLHEPVLSTVLDTSIADPDVDSIKVFVVSPINIADIQLVKV